MYVTNGTLPTASRATGLHDLHPNVTDGRRTNQFPEPTWPEQEDTIMGVSKRAVCGFGIGNINNQETGEALRRVGYMYMPAHDLQDVPYDLAWKKTDFERAEVLTGL